MVKSLNGVIESIPPLEGLVASKRIRLHLLGFDDQDFVVRVDPNQLIQVVMNLVLNSRDALRYQGNIWFELSSRIVDEEEAEVLELEAGEYAVFAVEDDGSGIDESIQFHLGLALGWFDHHCFGDGKRHGRSMKSVVDQSLSDVIDSNTCGFIEATKVDNTFVGDKSLISFVEHRRGIFRGSPPLLKKCVFSR